MLEMVPTSATDFSGSRPRTGASLPPSSESWAAAFQVNRPLPACPALVPRLTARRNPPTPSPPSARVGRPWSGPPAGPPRALPEKRTLWPGHSPPCPPRGKHPCGAEGCRTSHRCPGRSSPSVAPVHPRLQGTRRACRSSWGALQANNHRLPSRRPKRLHDPGFGSLWL
jgi:hypothetical protein